MDLNHVSVNANTSIHTARVNCQTAAPSIGALASSSTGTFTKGAKVIGLGKAAIALTGTWTSGSATITTGSTADHAHRRER